MAASVRVVLSLAVATVVGPLVSSEVRADGTGAVALAGPSAGVPLSSRGAPSVPAPPGGNVGAVAADRGPQLASSLAARLGLTYQDSGSFLLLSDAICRVRVYPNSHRLTLDGEDRTLRGYLARGTQGVTLPGPAAAIVEGHVLRARAQRLAPPPAPAPVSVPAPRASTTPKSLPAHLKLPAKAPSVPAAASQVKPDPSWVVAPTSRAWKWIVLHHSDDTRGNLDKYHQVHLGQGWEHGCGYHFVIGNGSLSGDGEVEVSQRWLGQLHGAHAKTPDNLFNEHGIGICLVGDFERGSGRPTAAQMRDLTRLTQWLMDRYGIALANVRGHCHCKATCCPGKNFPWGELRSRLRAPTGAAACACPPPRATAPALPAGTTAPALALRLPPAPGLPVAPVAAPAAAPPGPLPEVPVLGSPPAGLPPAGFPLPAR